ncbi:MAG: FAD-dependent oxidoreductase [Akkermansiaceae bacterium]|nr:FAD-dependent oxidoreductase [Akkermansiaceae bacterium]
MVEVIGFGLAGACVALQLQRAGIQVRVVDDGRVGSSHVAGGLVNLVAGRNFEPSWEVKEAWDVALPFYEELGDHLFQSVPILRLWRDEKDRRKFERKREQLGSWIQKVDDEGVTWRGGGWLDCSRFLKIAREECLKSGGEWAAVPRGGKQVWCAGAAGLIRGDFDDVAHRSAKGEILTVKIPGWGENRILNRNGWVIPIGNDLYRVGATYDWDHLTSGPTEEGREKVESLLRTFTDRDFEVTGHVAGIRPIINRSKPVVRFQEGRGWMVNGLGSKGVIYAPRVGLEMAEILQE